MLRILIVDDEPFFLAFMQDFFRSCRHSCRIVGAAPDGRKAMDILESCEVDVIFTDIKMPVMDGCEAAKQIRALKRPDAQSIPIIAVTANAFAEDIAATEDAGMNAHISKPIDFPLLYKTLEKLMGSSD